MNELTEGELAAAASEGILLEGDATGPRRVDAELLRRCCRGLIGQIDPRGIRFRHFTIAGRVDLSGLKVPFPLVFEDCDFDSPVLLDGAEIHELALTGCRCLAGLLANGVRVRRDVNLSGSTVSGTLSSAASTSRKAAVWLCEARIGGRLLCVDTVIDGQGERSVQADRLEVGGNIRLLHRFSGIGEVRLIGAHIGGSLDLTGARIEADSSGLALDLGEATIDGSVFLIPDAQGRKPVVRGRIDMGRARISGQLLIRGATLAPEQGLPVGSAYSRSRLSGTALNAPRLSVGAETTLEDSCQVSGGIELSMSDLSSLSIGPGCSLQAPGRTVLDLSNAELRSTLTVSEGVPVHGTVRLEGTRVQGNLCLRGAVLSDPAGRYLVTAHGATIDGEAQLQGLRATGGAVGFRAATIGNVVDASDAQLANPGGYTLSLHQANIRGSVRMVGAFKSDGLVVLNRATIDGRLLCTGGTFTCPGPAQRNEAGHAIEAISATIRGGMDLCWKQASPSADFTDAATSFVADDPATWPERIALSGFTYDRLERPQRGSSIEAWDYKIRRDWLARQVPYDASPYEQAAQAFRRHGYTDGAKAIQIAQQRRARQYIRGPLAQPRRVLDVLYDITVGYGHRPGRVLWLLAVLIGLVTASLQIPAAQATMRATVSGTVFTTRGTLTPGAAPKPAAAQASSPSARDAAAPCGGGEVRCFNSFLYAFDTVIPLISLGQRSTWYPDADVPYGTFVQWWLYVASVLGWLLSSVFVLSLAALARSS